MARDNHYLADSPKNDTRTGAVEMAGNRVLFGKLHGISALRLTRARFITAIFKAVSAHFRGRVGNSRQRANPLGFSLCLALVLLHVSGCMQAQNGVFSSDQLRFEVQEVVTGLNHHWGLAFLPDGDILVTERSGRQRRVLNGTLLDLAVGGLPDITQSGQVGLLGIELHPYFERTRWVYIAYAARKGKHLNTDVLRGRLEGAQLQEVEVVFSAQPKVTGGRHFGARLLFAPDATLFISLGDRGFKPSMCRDHPAQSVRDHIGTLVRINADGSIPADNPFVNREGARPEIFTYGNRNMQGMAIHPESGRIWTHEHGPQGGDELNIMEAGANYGWPVITYGANYGTGSRICEGNRTMQGMQQPEYKWVPSIAPSGMAFYSGDLLSDWNGDLFVGSLKFGLLIRLELEGDRIVAEERLLDNAYGRIRDVVQGPDGALYLLTDSGKGSLLKIVPAQ